MLLASLAHREVIQKGLDLSLVEMIDELNNIREVALIHKKTASTVSKGEESRKNQVAMSRMNPSQKKLTEILEIPMVLRG